MPPTDTNAFLHWEVFVTPGIPIVTRDKPPDVRQTYFQAMAATLIYGVRDAVLVDAFMTVTQANALADWVAARGRNLTTIYITHGHGDHWFGVATLIDRRRSAKYRSLVKSQVPPSGRPSATLCCSERRR